MKNVSAPANFAIIGHTGFSQVNFRGPLIEDIVARGHRVFALAPDFDAPTRAAVRALGAEPVEYSLSRTGLNPGRDFVDSFKLFRTLDRLNVDCVLSYAIKPVIYGTLAASLARVPRRHALVPGLGYAFTEGEDVSLKRRVVGLSARRFYRLALARADCVFMQNPDDAHDFVSMGIVDQDKIITVDGTGIRLDEWAPTPPVSSPVTFLLVARMLRDKGVFEFVEAARAVREVHPQARFILAGDTDANPEAISRLQLTAWAESGIVEWPGQVAVKEWLAQASVFVLPSYREGVPRSTQEAMAMGRPIITTDAPGCRETVIAGENGFLVPPRDAEALAAAMRRFITEPGLISSMGAKSRAYAEEKFDVRNINAVMIRAMGL
ncbi:glycosyltransferase family 1 protein [Pseudorhizobium endolithicum]|uniref:Glycosyltransferase family 1 protein n=1 Tax=Pseudorhizobium endolithicum TaxID=1191678 RepID=A0ABN7JKA0_9HYPH|nr:glycosyltransferase family 4 protein [Pseudorhizobium endolithicum]CAD7035472.1 glycosyltransferase family 1 protein [Pseudorhizobium endolithicum]